MKLSEDTIALLKNYTAINSNLFVEANSDTIKTWTVTKHIYAKAQIPETFPVDLAIYDLNEFLSVLDIFKGNADIEFGEDGMIIGDGKSKVVYQYSDPSMLTYPDKEINLPESMASFEVSKEDISNIINVSSKLSAPDVSFKNVDGKINIVVSDIKGGSGNTYTIEAGECTVDHPFDIQLKTENLRVLYKDYTVSVYDKSKPLVHFKSKDGQNEYYIAIEKGSKV